MKDCQETNHYLSTRAYDSIPYVIFEMNNFFINGATKVRIKSLFSH